MNYREIKAAAKDMGVGTKDLIALAPQNDPFYVGSKAQLAKARWFSDLWERFGYDRGVHLRRIHYQVVSQKPAMVKPDGETYENTLNCWAYLNLSAKYARYLKLVPARYFVDRRNPKAIINAFSQREDRTPGYGTTETGHEWDIEYDLPDLPELDDLPDDLPDLPDFDVEGYTPQWSAEVAQDYLVEIWAEKTTMNDVLEPLCRRYKVNLVTGAGELSITAVIDLMVRIRRGERPARIFYISDYDPAGLGMPVSVARKIEFFQKEHGYADLDVRLQPIILTRAQVAEYDLPRVPVKDSDKRKAHFEAAYGEGQVELDALEALYPGALAKIAEAAILDYYDPTLTKRTQEAKDELQETLDGERDDILDTYANEKKAIEEDYGKLRDAFVKTQERFAELVADFQDEIDAHDDELQKIRKRGKDLYTLIQEDIDDVDVDLDEHELPEPDLPQETNGTLYNSQRGYFDQLDYYRDYRDGTNHN